MVVPATISLFGSADLGKLDIVQRSAFRSSSTVEQFAVNEKVVGSNPTSGASFRQGFSMASQQHRCITVWQASNTDALQHGKPATQMHYSYILLSSKSHSFYFGSTKNLQERLILHNKGLVTATKPYCPWHTVRKSLRRAFSILDKLLINSG